MIDPTQLLNNVIRPVCRELGLWSTPAERQILGTACKETECGRWLVQLGGGPALGIYQEEHASHEDIWDNFLAYRNDLAGRVRRFMLYSLKPSSGQMAGNLYYATAMCRIHYFRFPETIPDNLPGQAALWKLRYNTPKGKGTEQEYINAWQQLVSAELVN